jgi:hypothetical protein
VNPTGTASRAGGSTERARLVADARDAMTRHSTQLHETTWNDGAGKAEYLAGLKRRKEASLRLPPVDAPRTDRATCDRDPVMCP